MSFVGSAATIIKNLSGFTARVDSSGYLYAQIAGAELTVDISGDAVNISGQTISINNASGRNFVSLVDSANQAIINGTALNSDTTTAGLRGVATLSPTYGLDPTAGTYNRIRSTISGSAASASGVQYKLLTASVLTNQDATNTANVINNNLAVTISDDGTNVASVATFADNATTFNALGTWAMSFGWDETAGRFNRVRTSVSGSAASASGTQFKLLTAGPITNQDATQTVGVDTSGKLLASISGAPISTLVGAATHKTELLVQIISASGGTRLTGSTSVSKLWLKNAASGGISNSSGVMFVGSHNFNIPWVATPQSGLGYPLFPGEEMIFENTTAANIRVVALTSGQPLGVFQVGI